jgi:hypothetical protein
MRHRPCTYMRSVAFLTFLLGSMTACGGGLPGRGPTTGELEVRVVERVTINGVECHDVVQGQLNEHTGVYSLRTPDPHGGMVCANR